MLGEEGVGKQSILAGGSIWQKEKLWGIKFIKN
jgi:hypothetical protein